MAHHLGYAGNPVLDNLGSLRDQRNLANLNVAPDSAAVTVVSTVAV